MPHNNLSSRESVLGKASVCNVTSGKVLKDVHNNKQVAAIFT